MEDINKTNPTEDNLDDNLTECETQENPTEDDLQGNLTEDEALEKLTNDFLEEIAGGTVEEYSDLLAALSINPKLQKWGRFAAHLPGGNLVASNASDGIKGILKEIDIKLDLSLGLGGTGLFSSKNKYTRISTGESMTHEEVIAEMKRHFTLD